jgi:hypothetical protein
MVEILISVEIPQSRCVPIQISLLYNEDGDVESVDWRYAERDLDELETIWEVDGEDWEDEDSDDDPDWKPGIDTDTDDDDDY